MDYILKFLFFGLLMRPSLDFLFGIHSLLSSFLSFKCSLDGSSPLYFFFRLNGVSVVFIEALCDRTGIVDLDMLQVVDTLNFAFGKSKSHLPVPSIKNSSCSLFQRPCMECF